MSATFEKVPNIQRQELYFFHSLILIIFRIVAILMG